MRHLQRRYRVVSLAGVLEAARRRTPLPARAVLVTFDDAYRDFLDAAWPILEKHRIPATMFVPTAYAAEPERSFWWDRLHRCFTNTTRAALEVERSPTRRMRRGGRHARRRSNAASPLAGNPP